MTDSKPAEAEFVKVFFEAMMLPLQVAAAVARNPETTKENRLEKLQKIDMLIAVWKRNAMSLGESLGLEELFAKVLAEAEVLANAPLQEVESVYGEAEKGQGANLAVTRSEGDGKEDETEVVD
ncbi:hypothetical protein LTR17_018865 [Elasticomyces elasticus]|nr:hypothetical protein LTR17_018865 [Elasticomyces elasticus]